ncbi:LacI family DNA-binding transcriptional regulator [Rhodoferax sp. GW822-FHT02A01]|uniref:LacI family DNA-binding transcriptional regulator n=1 Tax=Rhodoferax sp. GW822-FHT02A01 TaxID=3141537 RepID=UPI00315DEEEE
MATRPPSTRTITIVDVAAEANVSKSTVSLVLKGSPLIKGETADRVKEAAQRLGYVYNRRAGELRGNASNAIGVVINDLMNPFFAEILVGIERKLVEAGYVVLMAHTREDVVLQDKVLQSMREQHAAGIMLCPALNTPRSILKTVQSWGIPLTVFVRNLGPGSYDFAGGDSERGVYLATTHLIEAGHKRIGFLGGQNGVVFTQRLSGYKQALQAHGMEFKEELVIHANPNREGGHQAMNALLAVTPPVTAAVGYNDIVAFGALSALGEKGLRAGSDIALFGFDNVLDSAHSNPPLSTVDIRPSELGEQAAAILLQRIQNPNAKRMIYTSAPELVIRQTG